MFEARFAHAVYCFLMGTVHTLSTVYRCHQGQARYFPPLFFSSVACPVSKLIIKVLEYSTGVEPATSKSSRAPLHGGQPLPHPKKNHASSTFVGIYADLIHPFNKILTRGQILISAEYPIAVPSCYSITLIIGERYRSWGSFHRGVSINSSAICLNTELNVDLLPSPMEMGVSWRRI